MVWLLLTNNTMNCLLLITIFILALSARQFPSLKFNEKLLKSGTLNKDQLKQVCGISNVTEKRIIGGENATLNAWPWMAAIFVRNNFSRVPCGGVLINNKYVLTAAHCLIYRPKLAHVSDFIVRLGDLNIHSTSDGAKHEDFKVTKFKNHEKYPNGSDIGLIELDRNVTFSQSIIPICLPDSPDLINSTMDKTEPFVIGWGRMAHDGKGSSILQQAKVRVIPKAECKKDDSIICAGDAAANKSSCYGDSGGPLMLKNSKKQYCIIGIVSGGNEKCSPPSFYTRVTSYLDWIKKNAGMK